MQSGSDESPTASILAQVMQGESTESKNRIAALKNALDKMNSTTQQATRCCDALAKRSKELDGLTSPASDASAMLSQAASNLGSTLVKLKDARDKFETVRDCEPAIVRLDNGVRTMEDIRRKELEKNEKGEKKDTKDTKTQRRTKGKDPELSEQDVYAAADSMEILRDAFEFFGKRTHWKSTPQAMQQLERVHKIGVNSMCTLISYHLLVAGQALKLKRGPPGKKIEGGSLVPAKDETAEAARTRLTLALQNRDLLKSIGEYEESQPVEPRPIREMRALFDCLGGDGTQLGKSKGSKNREHPRLAEMFGVQASKVVRTEKVGSGGYSDKVKKSLQVGFPHLNAYGEARKEVAFKSIDGYYRRIKAERKKTNEKRKAFDDEAQEGDMDADAAARDAVRCLEHAMVVVAGEKNIYRAIVAPSLVPSEEEGAPKISAVYRKACVGAYSYITASVVDRTMDIIETVFLKEGGIGQSSGAEKEGTATGLTVRAAASAAAAGLRILDGVRMLGPSLAKLCEMPLEEPSGDRPRSSISQAPTSIASSLCIAIHRTTVKNTAKTLENLAKAIQEDPVNGLKHRPPDARLASVSSDVVRSIRLISPFVSAYKSVTKRRALPWDPNIGEEAGEMDSYVRFLIMRLLNSLQGKALNYTKNEDDEGGQAKSNMFMINNTFYLLQQLAPDGENEISDDIEVFQLDQEWFRDKVNAIFTSEKGKYLAHWENINSHLTNVDSAALEYQKNKTLLSLDSGRLFKGRFKGFNDDFEHMYNIHNKLSMVDPGLRKDLQGEVKKVFLKRYEKFYDKYSKYRFSKKKQNEYLKYAPQKVDNMLNSMYGGNLVVTTEDNEYSD